jgi:hypothetical protein
VRIVYQEGEGGHAKADFGFAKQDISKREGDSGEGRI